MASGQFRDGEKMNERDDVLATIDQASALVRNWLQKSADQSVAAMATELNRLKIVVKKEWPLSDAELEKLWLGPYAAKNLEDSYPELATLLEHIHYLCKSQKESI